MKDELKRNMEAAEVFEPGDGACMKAYPEIKFLVTHVLADQSGVFGLYKDGSYGFFVNAIIKKTGERYPKLMELLAELPE